MTVVVLLAAAALAATNDLSSLCADRTAIERVYYNHRTGEKPPFEKISPPFLIERLVKEDLHKENVLKKIYGLTITAAAVAAEVQRINATTRAPEILAELKGAVENDLARFARTVAKPIVVERTLRDRFENDDKLHSAQRRQVEQTRDALLAAKKKGADFNKLLLLLKQSHSNAVTEMTWQLAPRPEDAGTPPEGGTPNPDNQRKFYFEDLPHELQNVLRAQLRQASDVSAVIEMPTGFALYVAKEKTEQSLSVATLSIPKRSYEQWLVDQTQPGVKPPF